MRCAPRLVALLDDMATFPDITDVSPLQVLCIGRRSSMTESEAFGPLQWRFGATLESAAQALEGEGAPQVLVVDTTALPDALLDWPGLAVAVRRCAVVVVAAAPTRVQAWAWLRAGVQDVLPRERCDDAELARAACLALRRWQQQEDVRRAWSIDLETGLPNRTQLMELMHQLCALREREPAPMALAVFRLEGLFGCDASLGVAAAPTLRRKLAVRLRAGLRASDVVATLDGDRFAVLLTRLDAPQDARKVVDKLLRALHAPLSFAGQPVRVEAACGLALHPLQAQHPETLLQLALAGAQQVPEDSGAGPGHARRGGAANDG